MDYEKSRITLSALANGVDPRTGEVFPEDSPYQTADVIRALYVAISALDMQSSAKRSKNTPRHAGQPWTEAEDTRLLAHFESGASIEEIARLHERTVPGIQARLERHGKWHRPLGVFAKGANKPKGQAPKV